MKMKLTIFRQEKKTVFRGETAASSAYKNCCVKVLFEISLSVGSYTTNRNSQLFLIPGI